MPVAYVLCARMCFYVYATARMRAEPIYPPSNENQPYAPHSGRSFAYYRPCYFESFVKMNRRTPTASEMFRKFAGVTLKTGEHSSVEITIYLYRIKCDV